MRVSIVSHSRYRVEIDLLEHYVITARTGTFQLARGSGKTVFRFFAWRLSMTLDDDDPVRLTLKVRLRKRIAIRPERYCFLPPRRTQWFCHARRVLCMVSSMQSVLHLLQ